ncbi:MAG: hypothetical protein A3D74_03925 [Candidatus Levybacteria bacterium RIFCSPHIGHO2_02_FULL_37_13]|nr:MAG: hypothetical protein A3D74_03925 [Candidatus Levybacteria bacterium RIFCSPHIGHO2_02_FULL_37_13]OGH29296.1 MAG: hypothetical protein A3E40_00080 [Candidatus Levybacteria bacterium RIFCSPHIGHO2_12_FULL_37_9]OGH39597.1 MAG: hypothetical protein A3B41_01935 [Candidatus Levybacteria bacterium RIFCSPLOWO2_01_FULL_37_26]
MLEKNCKKVLKLISPKDIVLDIGGWAIPFNRANYVVDLMPYETRGIHGFQGPDKEHFSKDSWIVQDISSRKPLPFKDKEIDFVVCSDTLEDIKDPLYVCSEIIRVGKRGYIGFPSRTIESIMGMEGERFAGYSHHRWLIDIVKNKIIFRFKNHFIHHSWKYHLPKSYLKKLKPEDHSSYLFWKNSFEFEEVLTTSSINLRREMEEFVKSKKAYPSFYYYLYAFDSMVHVKSFIKNFLLKHPRSEKLAERIFGKTIKTGLHEESFWKNMPDIPSK